MLRTILRRSIVAFVVCGVFLLWAMHRGAAAAETAIALGVLLPMALLIGTVLSWPPNRLVRVLIIAVLCVLAGTRGQFDVVTTLATAVPAALLILFIAAVDRVVVAIGRRRGGQ